MDSNKPLASLVIFFYNQVDYVEESVKGALSQTYENLEIILSDDCSTDGTYDKILKCIKNYHGAHTIIVNRNENNIGLVPHVNKVLFKLSHGRFIFLQGGDDISLPNRVADGMDYFIQDPSIGALTSALIYIDGKGCEFNRMNMRKDIRYSITDKKYLSSSSLMWGMGMLAIKRDIIDVYGPLSADCQTEDSCFRFRAILMGNVVALSKYGVKYRIHGNNMSIGDVIYKLKTHPIAQQYRKDLNIIKNGISPALYSILKKKIDYYEASREADSTNAISSSIVKKVICKVKRKILFFVYQNKLKQEYNEI